LVVAFSHKQEQEIAYQNLWLDTLLQLEDGNYTNSTTNASLTTRLGTASGAALKVRAMSWEHSVGLLTCGGKGCGRDCVGSGHGGFAAVRINYFNDE
jgi:hypothetical protein